MLLLKSVEPFRPAIDFFTRGFVACVSPRRPFADHDACSGVVPDSGRNGRFCARISCRRYPERELSDRTGAALHGQPDCGAHRWPPPDQGVPFAPARRGKGNPRADPRRRHRSQSYQCRIDRDHGAGDECAGDAVSVPLHRASAEGAGWTDRQRNPRQLRAVWIRRPGVLRFRRPFDLQQRPPGHLDGRPQGVADPGAAIRADGPR